MNFKEQFFKWSIKRQITFGMVGVSLGSAIILICLIIINCYAFMSKTLGQIVFLLEVKDDELLNSVISLYDTLLLLSIDQAKNQIQFLRNIKINYDLNPDIYKHLNSDNIKKNFKYKIDYNRNEFDKDKCLTENQNCFYYCTSENDEDLEGKELVLLSLQIPMIKVALKIKNDNAEYLFRTYQYTSMNNPRTCYFPITSQSLPNLEFSSKDFSNNSDNVSKFLQVLQLLYLTKFNDLSEDVDYIELFSHNPQMLINIPPYNFVFPYTSSNESLYYIMSVNNNPALEYNYMQLELQKDYYNLVTDEVSLIFPEISVITMLTSYRENDNKTINDYVGTASSCRYFQKLLSFFSNNTYETITYNKLSECMTDKKFIEDFDNFFNSNYTQTTYSSTFYNFIRQGLLTLSVEKNRQFSFREVQFKIFKIFLPIKPTRAIFSSNYYSNFIGTSYFFRNHATLSTVERNVNFFLIGLLAFIVLYVLIFWFIILIIVYIKASFLAKEITTPFNGLVKDISVKTKLKKKKDFRFKYDKDIDDLFQICKNFIKGGAYEESKPKKSKGINCYNNVAIIKTNNLIIDEKVIFSKENEFSKNIFDYGKRRKSTNKISSNINENIFNRVLGDSERNEKEIDLREFFAIPELRLDEKIIAKREGNNLYEQMESVINSI